MTLVVALALVVAGYAAGKLRKIKRESKANKDVG